MRRALSSESGFFGFLDLGFGLLRLLSLPSLRVHGSGLREHENLVRLKLGFLEDLEYGVFKGMEHRKEECRASMVN